MYVRCSLVFGSGATPCQTRAIIFLKMAGREVPDDSLVPRLVGKFLHALFLQLAARPLPGLGGFGIFVVLKPRNGTSPQSSPARKRVPKKCAHQVTAQSFSLPLCLLLTPRTDGQEVEHFL